MPLDRGVVQNLLDWNSVSEEGVGRVVDEEDDGGDACVDVEGPAVCWV